jgi:hypothetical protein
MQPAARLQRSYGEHHRKVRIDGALHHGEGRWARRATKSTGEGGNRSGLLRRRPEFTCLYRQRWRSGDRVGGRRTHRDLRERPSRQEKPADKVALYGDCLVQHLACCRCEV